MVHKHGIDHGKAIEFSVHTIRDLRRGFCDDT